MTEKTACLGIVAERGMTVDAVVLGLCLGLLPLLPLLAPQGAHFLVPLAVLAMARIPPVSRPVLLTTGAFLFWCAISVFWTKLPGGWERWFGQVAIEVPFGLAFIALAANAPAEVARRAGLALAVGVILAGGLILFDLFTSGMLHGLLRPERPYHMHSVNRPMVVVCLLCWPAAVALYRRGLPFLAAVPLVVAGVAAFSGESGTALLAMAVGTVILAVGALLPRTTMWVLGVGGAAGILLSPILAVHGPGLLGEDFISRFNPLTVLARIQIWHASGEVVFGAPWIGQGMGAIDTVKMPEIGWLFADQKVTHPHNAALQVWIDLGVVGAAFLAIAHVAAVRLAGRNAMHLATVGALTATLMTSWNIWAAWWLATIAGVLAAIALGSRRDPDPSPAA